MRNTRVKPSPCLACGKNLDSAISTTGKHKPRPDDVTVCLDCHHIMAFAWDMSLRELTDEEITDIAGDPRLLRAMHALGEFKQSELWKEKHK